MPVDRAVDRLGVRIDEELGRVETQPLLRRVRTVHTVAVALAGTHARQVDVPLKRGAVVHVDAPLAPVLVEQAQLDALRALRPDREVRPGAIPRGTLREGPPRPRPA